MFHSLFSWEPHCGKDVWLHMIGSLLEHVAYTIVTYMAFSGAFVVENESILAGDCEPKEQI